MAKTILCEGNLSKYFWAETINTACYILNHILIHPILKKTPYELWKGKKSNINYFHIFGYKYFILNKKKDNLKKFDAKSDKGIFLGYSASSKIYKIFNKHTLVVEESIHIIFDKTNNLSLRKEEARRTRQWQLHKQCRIFEFFYLLSCFDPLNFLGGENLI